MKEKIDNNKILDENNDILINKDNSINCEDSNKLPVLKEDLTWYQKIKIRIIAFLNKIFRKKIVNKENESV